MEHTPENVKLLLPVELGGALNRLGDQRIFLKNKDWDNSGEWSDDKSFHKHPNPSPLFPFNPLIL